MSCSGDWQHYEFDPDQSSFTSLHIIEEEHQEIVNHGYRCNITKHTGGVVKLGKKIQMPHETQQ